MCQDKIHRINGNGQPYVSNLPKLMWLTDFINDVALQHIFENTGLNFVKAGWWYEAQPTNANQIATLFMTYNFKTRYYDNASHKNTLMLKGDHHIGFDVDSICYDCMEYNHIYKGNLKKDDRLAC
ncbi:MAG TPA: hypothetical protein DC057_01140 [Spirochaetia bacterium]|nr:hypothetical protein [Spirochaetia bacterium]